MIRCFWLLFLCFSASAWLDSPVNKHDSRDRQWEQVKEMWYLYEGSYEQRVQARKAKRALVRSGDINSLPAQRLLVEFLSNRLLRPEVESLLKRQARTVFSRSRRAPLYKETQIDLWNMFRTTEEQERRVAYKILRSIPLHPDMQAKLVSALHSLDLRKPARLILSAQVLYSRSQDMLMNMLNSEDQAKIEVAEQVLLRREGPLTANVQSVLIKDYLFNPYNPEKRKKGRDILESASLNWRTRVILQEVLSQASLQVRQENQIFTDQLLADSTTPDLLESMKEKCFLAFRKFWR